MNGRTVLISGASIAGPALAYWLGRHGFRPTIVEIAPALRTGGNAVDYRGPVHLGLLSRMGVLEELRAVQTGGTAMRFVDEHDRRLMEMPSDFAGGDVEILRGDLSRILCAAGAEWTEYLFGDSIAALDETPDGVDVTFAGGARRTFDLVIGADGVHSAVRRLTFGPERQFVRHLGYYVAGWDVPNDLGLGRDTLNYNVPGRLVSIGGDHRDPDRAGAFVAFASPEIAYDRHDLSAQKRIVRERFAGLGWRVPRLLDALDTADDLYFDQICRVDIDTWHRGRIALVGDAACGATIGGMGNGTAVVAAYVLAGELAAAGGDHAAAFTRYQARIGAFARRAQRGGGGAGRFLAPRRAYGIRVRNWLHNQGWFMALTMRVAGDRSAGIDLPDYEATLV
ncbi:FAD-dependent monooxygenase [Amorphoplanes digitatis]|uniref:2-polyprenyl-6-methoxyphenol hydroxylase-like FAD-dependent oxidoreductase n=1 Tax=Actinoplanes digitatis TaxID=1868 RepID=A0A7W7HUI5_9ACTN|nr:FAD-dependent monooxygenase [Actinoplanes digitatis]MBB4761083.1 2-polyprenyl-6-methoxyphenol hydroxylase-like FAD-dependent oxidoreductase [Actinoplanes digitatis]GID92699.1 FAD-dependent oxidoreductase [Actinoplanes digitatis]